MLDHSSASDRRLISIPASFQRHFIAECNVEKHSMELAPSPKDLPGSSITGPFISSSPPNHPHGLTSAAYQVFTAVEWRVLLVGGNEISFIIDGEFSRISRFL